MEIDQLYNTLKTNVDRGIGARSLLAKQLENAGQERGKAIQDVELWEKAQVLLQQTAGVSRVGLKNLVEPLISQALQLLLGPNARFVIDYTTVRGGVRAHLVTIDNDGIMGEGEDVHGGGVQDVESVLLRILFILRLGLPKVVILDEPYRNVHGAQALATIGEFLQRLSEDLGFQVIVVTGDEDTSMPTASKIIMLEKKKGKTHVK
jgi:hypothetical protein